MQISSVSYDTIQCCIVRATGSVRFTLACFSLVYSFNPFSHVCDIGQINPKKVSRKVK